MKQIRIPDENEVWYNSETKRYYVVRDDMFLCPGQLEFNMVPGDILNIESIPSLCIFDKNNLSCNEAWDGKNGWVLLVKVGLNQYQYLPELKIPYENELWYYTKTGGFYIAEPGVFVPLYKHIGNMLHDCLMISQCQKISRNENVFNNIGGWRFVSNDWKKYLMDKCSDPTNTL